MPGSVEGLAHIWPFLAAAVGGYLLGSLPFGLILTRLAGLQDIREIGSGNIGATNVLRTGRKGIAAATLLLDAGKGAAAVWIAGRFGPDMAVIAGAAAVLGHVFPVWLGFRGGKGVATAFGVLVVLCWQAGLVALAAWLLVAAVFRYSSLAAIVAVALAPVFAWIWSDPHRIEVMAAIAVLVIARHGSNIRRLAHGEEPRIGRSDRV